MPNNYVLLETIALTQSAASVTFDNLPTSGYTDLKIVVSGRDSSSAGQSWDGYSFTIRPNGLTTNITQRSLFGNGSGAASYSDTSMFNVISMNADTANTFSNVEIYIPNYRSSNAKSFSIDGVTENNATNSAIRLSAGLWNQTAAITSLQLSAYTTWMANSTFSLYGVAAFGTTPALAPKATGGNIVANDGTYWYHAFTSSGNFVPQVGLTADVLVVAGGGGGGSNGAGFAGGGGAGGLLLHSSQSLANGTNYACTIGAGGPVSTSGVASSFGALTASVGGGRGGIANNGAGESGGSGGGGAEGGAGGTNTSGQGFSGGAGNGGSANGGGGGGGAGVVGSAGVGGGGNGGAGLNTWSAWATATSTGVSGFYAGGGAGGSDAGTRGTGGSGGGGAGGDLPSTATVAGVVNTGSGGGGGVTSIVGSAGGSGIILIRYPIN